MESESAIAALGALAQSTRLAVFRLLVRHEPGGLAAGEIARRLEVPQNTMSAHLAVLARAGLVTAERRSRLVIYRPDLSAMGGLVGYLLEDCCAGKACLDGILAVPGCCAAASEEWT